MQPREQTAADIMEGTWKFNSHNMHRYRYRIHTSFGSREKVPLLFTTAGLCFCSYEPVQLQYRMFHIYIIPSSHSISSSLSVSPSIDTYEKFVREFSLLVTRIRVFFPSLRQLISSAAVEIMQWYTNYFTEVKAERNIPWWNWWKHSFMAFVSFSADESAWSASPSNHGHIFFPRDHIKLTKNKNNWYYLLIQQFNNSK